MGEAYLHSKFLNTSTSGFTLVSILDSSFKSNPLTFIHKAIDIYHERVRENTADDQSHDAIRTLLCYQYQLQLEKKIEAATYYSSNKNLIENLRKNLFSSGDNNERTKVILDDIAILQIIFHLNTKDIDELFKEALNFIETKVNEGNNNFHKYFPIIETLVDASRLKRKMDISDEIGEGEPCALIRAMTCWFQIIDDNNSQEWRPFISLILKLINAIDYPDMAFDTLWTVFRNDHIQHTDKKLLTLLCGIIDDLLSKSSEGVISINVDCCLDEKVLLLISYHLGSNIQLYRKQAQFVLKRIIEYLGKFSKARLIGHQQLKPPFIFCDDDTFDIEQTKCNYFLLLESLEEKQAHLVLPALSHLDNLVKASIYSQGSLLDTTWLRCIFIRLLNHDNNMVIKAGLTALLRMDLQILDDGFIALLIETLNNTFLYEDQSSEPHPRIIKELSELFIKAEQSKVNFTSKFIITAAKNNWSPIPLFYVFEALGNSAEMTGVKDNIWAAEELEALRVITEQYVRLQIKIMRVPTQRNILKCITIYVKRPLDFLLLGRIFSSIASDKVLERGNKSWKLLTNYLKENIEESNAVKSVSECCERLLRNEINSSDIKALAILIVLMYDTGNMALKASIISNSLCQLFTPITDAYKRPYADSSLFLKAMQMIICLMKLSPQADDTYIVLILKFSQSIFDLIMNSLRSNGPRSYEEATIYVEALSSILDIRDLAPCFAGSIPHMINIEDEELEKITELNSGESTSVIQSWYALNILFLKDDKSCDCIFNKAPPKFVSNEGNGKIVSECYGMVAKIYQRCVRKREELTGEFFNEFLTDKLMVLAETKSDHAVASIAATLGDITEKLLSNNEEMIQHCFEIMKNIIDICWKTFWDMSKTKEFWISAEYLIRLILNKSFLKVNEFRQIALNYVDDIISKTDNTSALRCMLFTLMKSLEPEYIFIFHDSILSSFLQTDVGKINKRIEMQTCCFITEHHKIDCLDENMKSGLGVYTDVITRAILVILILLIDREQGKALADIYVPQVIAILEKQKRKRYFGDSNVHRVKHRIMQILLILSWNDEIKIKIHDSLSELILAESDQPSVRMMQEWILVQMYIDRYPGRDLIWKLFPLAREKRPGSLTSLVSIVYHLTKTLNPDEQLEYIKKAVTNILPSCFSQQFIVRLYSQVILSKLFEMMDKNSPEQSNEYRSIREAVQESLRHGNIKTNSVKLLDNFYFSVFHSKFHWTLQTIFHELPRLTNVSMDEWIRPDIFSIISEGGTEIGMKIFNFNRKLSTIEVSQVSKEPAETPDSDLYLSEDAFADIQKKIIPATSSLSNTEKSVPTAMPLRQKLITNDTGLIVIASLIEGFPNLGGLARTAEIFCARELVLKSKRYTENKDFQSLSVTAEKWITISEIKPHELRDYLLEKKSMGWSLVGAEQTVNSVNLLDMKFNEKTILLLGSEKNGIPANLIQLMDTCVEIPQAGLVRSLNVHVTGAICMWQYAQQHLFSSL